MRTIKFRGTAKHFEKPKFGDLTHTQGHKFIDDFVVDDDSVAQLVGYDINGDEIYEGDTVISKYGIEGRAELCPAVRATMDGKIISAELNFNDDYFAWRKF